MKRSARRRDPGRLLEILEERVAKAALVIPVEVVPLAVIPKQVLNRAIRQHPRRPKGVPKAK